MAVVLCYQQNLGVGSDRQELGSPTPDSFIEAFVTIPQAPTCHQTSANQPRNLRRRANPAVVRRKRGDWSWHLTLRESSRGKGPSPGRSVPSQGEGSWGKGDLAASLPLGSVEEA
ncbi:hypothetical protein DPEC_G00049650 [Dallia pectoralis]|uniref:Uncharacterized protein n=1 Tax=Dallia pectoralis TaxID=75939 RepID=A0ACC2HB40_DALPE|nr:hypothetical protein DPEC_G00049650 [Dallia pectoralis]